MTLFQFLASTIILTIIVTFVSCRNIGYNIEYENINGITVKGSQVDVAPPYFTGDHQRLSFSSVIPDNSAFDVKKNNRIVTSRLDLDETAFNPLPKSKILTDTNSLMAMCHLAFAEHRPMALTPDLLWHYIIKGISIHINRYSDELREKFVNHEGKVELIVKRLDSFSNNDWPGVLKEFRSKIEANLTEEGKTMIFSKFSTTTDVIDDVSCIALMDAMSKYYDFKVLISCGIPSVTLLGTREDWVELKSRSKRVLDLLSSEDLKDDVSLAWWKPSLMAVLEKLIQCYDNPESTENMDWMARIYMSYETIGCGRGDTIVSGWVNVFFPYLGTHKYWVNDWANNDLIEVNSKMRNHFHGKDRCWRRSGPGKDISDFSKALSGVDFILSFYDVVQYNMTLTGGPCSISEQIQEAGLPSPPGTLHAHFGWMITTHRKNKLAFQLDAHRPLRKMFRKDIRNNKHGEF